MLEKYMAADQLPNALDTPTCAYNIGHYLIYLKDKSKLVKHAAYGDGAWGRKRSIYERVRERKSKSRRAASAQKTLYRIWDDADLDMEPHVGIIDTHPRVALARYGALPVFLDQTMDIALFCGGWHRRAEHSVQCVPPALIEQWRKDGAFLSTASYEEVPRSSMGYQPTNVTVPNLVTQEEPDVIDSC
ncbi:hypothetical protein CKM354_000371200 [Cercospora kikuchii]|uniref:Uncharacterized protein n=1 Tax=Cercospora kikuchii TaxID=84275 RepID=A0A9P3CEP4_9PEZI|nr:uncharacterized protein CKM354_000371200 [Cercospora kikuchii]GIZ40371.1 hypothetical protein CKM354_000371200 [Cercospora kikuchii]